MTQVHNHGTEEGEGLACPETRLLGGQLRGACMVSNWPRRAEDLADTVYISLPPLPEGLKYELVKLKDTGYFGVMIVRSESEESTEDQRS